MIMTMYTTMEPLVLDHSKMHTKIVLKQEWSLIRGSTEVMLKLVLLPLLLISCNNRSSCSICLRC